MLKQRKQEESGLRIKKFYNSNAAHLRSVSNLVHYYIIIIILLLLYLLYIELKLYYSVLNWHTGKCCVTYLLTLLNSESTVQGLFQAVI